MIEVSEKAVQAVLNILHDRIIHGDKIDRIMAGGASFALMELKLISVTQDDEIMTLLKMYSALDEDTYV